jgi:hypothetical protein
MRAFVSHSSADDRYVAEMESFLRAAGFDDVFNDVSAIRPDEKFWPEIEQGIAKCDSFVVVITAASNSSEWVKREVEYARNLSKNVIPVLIEDCVIPSSFADRDVIDFRPRSSEERRYDISRIVKYAPAELIGRHDETKLLHDAWGKVLRAETQRPHVLTFVALGGEGKTSLVAKWAAELAAQDWPGCDAAFAWSFYSQGTREQQAASSDLFLKEALNFFATGFEKEVEEIRAFAASPAGAFEKGQRLARIVGQRRNLLILDGLEPLQYPPTATAFKPGELKDQGVAKLLKDLATNSRGLCIVTTRHAIPDLDVFKGQTVLEEKLTRLSREHGVVLLKKLGVEGSERRNVPLKDGDDNSEKVNLFEKLVEDVKGHALTLQIMGGFLKRAFGGDIRQRDRVKFEKADERIDGGHAFRAMAAYAQWMEDGSDEAQRELAILRCLGLFDRPADAGCISALRREPAIESLTESLVELDDTDWNLALSSLADCGLISFEGDQSAIGNRQSAIDSHPHIREYFAKELREKNADGWRAAHRRLYEYLYATTTEGDQPTFEDLQPLYQAVAHGCQAGLQQEVAERVFYARIARRQEAYAVNKLGVFGSDLGAITCFFEQPWSRLSPTLNEVWRAWMLSEAAYRLRALGRLTEALEPMRTDVEICVTQRNWLEASKSVSNLSELELTLGEVVVAVGDAEQSVTYADGSGDAHIQIVVRATHGNALHKAGRRADAETRFSEAEQMQREDQPDYPLLYSVRGFHYCALLLAAPERTAWQVVQKSEVRGQKSELIQACRAISQRAAKALLLAERSGDLLSNALDHLTLGRAALYAAILTDLKLETPSSELVQAVEGLRRAGQRWFLPAGLLTRAWRRFLTGARTGPESAQEDLDEAWEIAERGPMKLFMADIHLYRARLFGGMKDEGGRMKYPWDKNSDGSPRGPKDDLAAAERLINECGYHRRDEELADAKEAAKNW